MKFKTFLVACSLTLAGCGGGKSESTSANLLRVNIGAEVQDLDPHLTTGVPEHRALSALFEGLTDVKLPNMEPEPGVAESWTVSEDGLVYTFKLRQNAKWSNGDPVTAEDFAFAWQRMLSPGLAAEYAYMLHYLKNGKPFNEGTLTDFSQVGVKVLDPYTLEVTLEHPVPAFLTMHSHQAWYPVQKSTIEKFGGATTRNTPWTRAGNHVGNGAFRLEEWSPGEVLRVVRNEHYWDTQHVRLDEIRMYPIEVLQTEERSFRSGELDWTAEVPLHRVTVYQQEQPELLTIHPYLGAYYYRINTTRPPFNDVRVRKAFSLALDRDEIVNNVVKAGETAAYSMVPPGAMGYEARAKAGYNVEQAKALLAEAGYPNGQGLPPVELLYNTSESHKTIAEAVQRMWKQTLGADVQLVNQEFKVYLATMESLDYGLARSGWIADIVDPINFLETFLSGSGNNRTGYASPAYDALITKAYHETNIPARNAILQDAEALLLEDLPLIPVYFYTRKYLKRPEVKGYIPNVLGYIKWEEIYMEGDAQ